MTIRMIGNPRNPLKIEADTDILRKILQIAEFQETDDRFNKGTEFTITVNHAKIGIYVYDEDGSFLVEFNKEERR